MGVTIHFEGQLKNGQSYEAVLKTARSFASEHGWHVKDIPAERRELRRVRHEQDWDYVGITRGIEILTHTDCEPVRLEFDENFYIQEYTKTQFAPVNVHVAIIGLLRLLEPQFMMLMVNDEGGFFETSELHQLEKHRTSCNRIIEEHKRANPAIASAVKLLSGRIIDLYG